MLSTVRRYLELLIEKAGVYLTDEEQRDVAKIDDDIADWEDNMHRTDALERRVGALEEKLKMPHPRDPALRTGC